MNMKKKKRRKRIFRREIVLQKLIEFGEMTAGKLLDTLQGLGTFASYMMLPYHQSYRKMRYGGSVSKTSVAEFIDAQSKAAFWSLLYKLKKEGLIRENTKSNLTATKIGRNYLETKNQRLSWFKRYKPIRNPDKNELILIIFDVPQKEHEKRDWLRFQFKNLDFRQLQLSVWFGNNLLPKEFLADLERHKILSYIHIFTVVRKGSVSEFLERIGERELAK